MNGAYGWSGEEPIPDPRERMLRISRPLKWAAAQIWMTETTIVASKQGHSLNNEVASSPGGVQGEAVREMRVGLSQPKCRLWLQTGSSCDG